MDIIREMKNEGILVERKFNIRKMLNEIVELKIEEIIAKKMIKDVGSTEIEDIYKTIKTLLENEEKPSNSDVKLCKSIEEANDFFEKYKEELNEYYIETDNSCIVNIYDVEDPLIIKPETRRYVVCGVAFDIAERIIDYIEVNIRLGNIKIDNKDFIEERNIFERKFNIRKMIDKISDFEIEKEIAKILIKEVGSNELEDIKEYLYNIVNNGALAGNVNFCIYYKDTTSFFEKYKEEINDYYRNNYYDECIHNIFQIDDDPLLIEDSSKNKFVCAIVENVANKMYEYIEENFELEE